MEFYKVTFNVGYKTMHGARFQDLIVGRLSTNVDG